MAKRHCKFGQVIVRQIKQNFRIDFVFSEHGLVLPKTEAAKPIPDVDITIPAHSARY